MRCDAGNVKQLLCRFYAFACYVPSNSTNTLDCPSRWYNYHPWCILKNNLDLCVKLLATCLISDLLRISLHTISYYVCNCPTMPTKVSRNPLLSFTYLWRFVTSIVEWFQEFFNIQNAVSITSHVSEGSTYTYFVSRFTWIVSIYDQVVMDQTWLSWVAKTSKHSPVSCRSFQDELEVRGELVMTACDRDVFYTSSWSWDIMLPFTF